ncbi:M20/M25/M40 family metallo-hydrolase [Candidatus Amarobacter glycogenicus]|uniref:M20/M25/M40 family metallo-hydrolase n=1 Tax=Candidatus Amarobacter glycogenicus TaxID=3140699 RepID=UPI002A167AE2|nr:M20/M25/M40 family metallo-hydrolase [Dehalococcoidia bacterium]
MSTGPAINWDTYFDEAVELLGQFIRIDTSNPPGNEILACNFLGAILHHEGIDYDLYDAGNRRVSLRAVLKGDGSRRPFMLLNHTDVVPVQQEFWDEEPFSGHIKDGYIWGRGTLDMKGLGIAQLMTFITLKRMAVPLARDVVFFAQADEEAGSEFGMRFIEREFPETLDAEYVINEGGGGTTEVFGVERPVYSIAVAEKGPLWLRLVAEGRPGHGSVPHEDNALDRLVRAMFRIQEWERPLTVAPVLEEYFGRLNRAGVYKGAATVDALKAAAEKDPRIRALLSNTISATTASSGIKHNVIPARAEATLDIRLLPGVKPEDFEAELAAVINDPKVSLERVHVGWSDTNPHDTELFRVMEEVIHDHVEDAVVVPGMTVGFTDSSVLRNRGMISYGFSGGLTTPEIARGVHGHNERVSLESFRLNCQMVWELTRRMCCA